MERELLNILNDINALQAEQRELIKMWRIVTEQVSTNNLEEMGDFHFQAVIMAGVLLDKCKEIEEVVELAFEEYRKSKGITTIKHAA